MHGIAPTIREIGDHFGLRSPGGIHRILMLLKEKGFILAESGKKRSWRSVGLLPGKGIPVLGVIAAGRPFEAVSFSDEELAVSPSEFGSDDCFALRVSGDSMIDAHILAGDLAIIRPQLRVENGEIAAVIIQDILPEATLKIVRSNRRTISLEPANRAYSVTVFRGAECQKVRVLGKCVGVIRKCCG
jgi:repressor LexA